MFTASPTIDSCSLSHNYYGVECTEGSNPVISNCEFATSNYTPIAIDFNSNPSFVNNTFSFADNTYDAIGLIGGVMTKSSTLPKRSVTGVPNVTYVLLSSLRITDSVELTIDPGVVIKPRSSSYDILVQGKLTANGTMAEPIVFTSIKDDNYGQPMDTNKDGSATAPSTRDWGGIIFDADSDSTSVMNHCIMQYGDTYRLYASGYYTRSSNLAIIKSNPDITNCTFTNADHGVSCYNTAAPLIEDSDFINASVTPLAVTANSDPTINNVSFTNAGRSAIGLIGNRVSANGTIRQKTMGGFTNIAYLLIGTLYIDPGTYIDIEPGVVIKCQSSASIRVEGGLQIVGTSSDPIILTSEKDDNVGNPLDTNGDGNATSPNYYDWQGIRFFDTSDDSFTQLNHFEVKYANSQLSLSFENANGIVKNGVIFGSNTGIQFLGTSETSVDSVSIENCLNDPLGMSLLANPTLGTIEFNSNGSNGILLVDEELSQSATLDKRSVAGFDNIAYILRDDLTIPPGVVWTISPGVVVKVNIPYSSATCECINIDGGIKVIGSAPEPVVFTSFRDDSAGGDTNNDGNATSPSTSWNHMRVSSSAIADSVDLQYADFRYASIGMIFNSGGGTVNNSTFQQLSSYGVELIGSANPNITNSQFININNTAIHMSMFAEPTFSNNLTSNVKYNAIRIRTETWSQSDTVPLRSFGGYDSITYLLPSANSILISSGTSIYIPAGVVFKQTYVQPHSGSYGNPLGFRVDGSLFIEGDMSYPVVFTHVGDDNYGSPADTELDGNLSAEVNTRGSWLVFRPGSDDASEVRNVLFRNFQYGIKFESASPWVDNCEFVNGTYGLQIEGNSAPVVTDNSFEDLTSPPMRTSILTYPDSTSGNQLLGTTRRAIAIINETLSQDYTLPKRSFGGINAIPYYFSGFTVGTGAVLSIEPGVICKFTSGQLRVQKGLQALGGEGNQSIVFTSSRDDFYGGDTNSDSTQTSLSYSNWSGIRFENEAIDALCKLDNCIIRGATYGVYTNSASPTITNTAFQLNNYGVYAAGASNPSLDTCDFSRHNTSAILNQSQAFTIDAENCWWGDCTGPTHSANPGGSGEEVSDAVDYDPFFCGPKNPLMGDVSLNGEIQAYDASLILQYVATLISLDTLQKEVADVSGQMGITALDASLVLQYLVGLIDAFPAESTERTQGVLPVSEVHLALGNESVLPGDTISIPVRLSNVVNLLSSDVLIQYEADDVEFLGFTANGYASDMQHVIAHDEAGFVQLVMAGAQYKSSDGVLGQLSFAVSPTVKPGTRIALDISRFLANEDDLTEIARGGTIEVMGVGNPGVLNIDPNSLSYYPNPFSDQLNITIDNPSQGEVRVSIFDMGGRQMEYKQIDAFGGVHTMRINTVDYQPGVYVLKVETGTSAVSHLITRL